MTAVTTARAQKCYHVREFTQTHMGQIIAEKIIDSSSFRANIRGAKAWGQENVIWSAPLGTPFEIIDDTSSATWTEGTFLQNGRKRNGFVFHTVVRDPVSEVREDLVRECIKWYELFNNGTGAEDQNPFNQYVGKFWQALGFNWDGNDTNIAWSAAFISYVVRVAGGYTGFNYSLRHSDYIYQAIRRREDSVDGPFWGYRLHEEKPEVGDLICQWRNNNVDYDYAKNNDQYSSHCDLVVSVKAGKAYTLGGNVMNTVGRRIYTLDANGFLPPERNVFALLKNRR